jgi:hypothetical protein
MGAILDIRLTQKRNKIVKFNIVPMGKNTSKFFQLETNETFESKLG